MKINLLNCVPKGWNVKRLKNYLKISYKVIGRGNNPKTITIPNKIKFDETFIAAIGMYLGDGKLSKDRYHLEFSNKDTDLIIFMKKFFEGYLKVKEISYYLKYKKGDKNPIKKLSKILNIEIKNAKESDRHKHPTISMQIGSKILRKIFKNIVNRTLNSNFLDNKNLRRAFLRGLFAAEGTVGISKERNYIVYIDFCLHSNETYLAYLCSKILSIENIRHKIKKRDRGNSMYVRITRWDNYWKYYKIGIFDLNERKKQMFLEKCKNTNFQCIINRKFLDKLINSKENHRRISIGTGIFPSVIHALDKNKREWISVVDLIKLSRYNQIENEEIKQNIINTRVNRGTLIYDIKFRDFIVDVKDLW